MAPRVSSEPLPQLLPRSAASGDLICTASTMPSSPLAISNIVLSQSEHSGGGGVETPKVSCYREALQPNPVPVLLRVRRARVVLGSFALAGAVAAIVIVLARGVTLRTIRNPQEIATQAQRNDLVQEYNAYVAMVTTVLVRPLQVLTALVVPVWFWCFLTPTAMAAESRGNKKAKIILSALAFVLFWLLSNATHGINVQLERIQPQQQTTSLSSSASPSSVVNGSDTNAPSNSSDSLANSILRSAVTLDYRSAGSSCTRTSPQRLIAAVDYGFPSRTWMNSLQDASISRSTIAITSSSSSIIPKTASSLIAYAFPMMEALFLSSAERATRSFNSTAFANDFLPGKAASTSSELSRRVNASLNEFTTNPGSTRLQWFDVDNVNVSLSSANVSSSLVFESVTLDIPSVRSYMQRRLTLINSDTTSSVSYDNRQSTDYFFDINVKEECGEHACIVSPRSEKATDAAADGGAQMWAIPICSTADGDEDMVSTMQLNASACATISKNSFLVLSFAQRIEGESFNQTDTHLVQLKNARKVYSVTVGRLHVMPSDSTAALRLNENEVVVADQTALPLAQLALVSSPSSWVQLVSTTAQEIDAGGNLKGDLVFPDDFDQTTSLDTKTSGCETQRGSFLATIQQNHWFSREARDDHAFAASVFWLFRDGVVRSDFASSPSSPLSVSSYARLVVKVPRLSAILAYCGCAIVLLLSVAIALFSKRHESRLEKYFTPFHLAQRLAGSATSLVPSSWLLHADLLNLGGDLLTSSEPLDEFEIVSLTLRHRHSPTLIAVPKPLSLTSGSSFMA